MRNLRVSFLSAVLSVAFAVGFALYHSSFGTTGTREFGRLLCLPGIVGIFGAVLLVSSPHGGGNWGAVAFTSVFINAAFLWLLLTARVSVVNRARRRERQGESHGAES